MIAGSAFYNVMTAIVPLYVAMILGYGSVKWWRRLTPEQCSGINRFVSDFAVPLLSFHFISTNNPYTMNLLFVAADTLQKFIVLALLVVWNCLFRRASLEWTITIFSLSTLPNTLVMGIPLLKGMYGDFTGSLMVQTVVFQSIIWYTLMLVMFEYRSARNLIAERFPDEASSITGIAVGPDVESFDGQNETLETVTEVKDNGGIFVTVRRSNASGSDIVDKSSHRSMGPSCSATPRPSNLTNAEIYSMPSSRNPTPRVSSFNSTGRSSSVAAGDALGLCTSATPTSSIDEEDAVNDSEIAAAGRNDRSEEYVEQDYFSFGNRRAAERDVEAEHEMVNHEQGKPGVAEPTAMPPTGVLMSAIPVMVWRRLIHNPNTYSSVIGLIWSLFCFRWNIEIPAIILKSISILSDAGLGMAMFSLGLSMALQPRIIACGTKVAMFSMVLRFLAGPAVMAAASLAVGLRGTLLHVAILQAALPQGIVPFVFAKEYGVHPEILSTGVIFGMLIALPITLLYYILLGL